MHYFEPYQRRIISLYYVWCCFITKSKPDLLSRLTLLVAGWPSQRLSVQASPENYSKAPELNDLSTSRRRALFLTPSTSTQIVHGLNCLDLFVLSRLVLFSTCPSFCQVFQTSKCSLRCLDGARCNPPHPSPTNSRDATPQNLSHLTRWSQCLLCLLR
mgnify:CR=1 FL=1